MHFEVEQKFPVRDLSAIQHRLEALGVGVFETRIEADLYYAHPARDFALTDEALRIRQVGGRHFLAYKGPKIDPTTKTRQELELPLPSDEPSAAAWRRLLEVLGFRPIAEVRKRRRKANIFWQDRRVEASLDEVEELGSFVELELLSSPEDLEAAKACVASLAEHLGLAGGERRSYLELLLQKRA